MGVAQVTEVRGEIDSAEILTAMEEVRRYMENLGTDPSDICKNKNKYCTIWSLKGECDRNTKYMNTNCPAACKTCELLTVEGRCPLDPHLTPAWKPNAGLNDMFSRLTTDPVMLNEHEVKIHSSPALNDGPWIITMENVLSDEEADRFIELGGLGSGYQRSMSAV